MSVTLHPASHTTFHDLIAMEEEIEDLLMEEEEILSETQTSKFENPEDAVKKKNEIKEILKKFYEEYAMPPPPPPPTQSSSYCSSDTTTMSTSSSQSRGGKKRRQMTENWRKETRANDVVVLKHEIDRYITDPIEDVVDEFDVLKWWKLNGVKYPGLALIAKDVLAIPVSTVASESCFSTGGRVVNSFRASLTPKIVEALICSQNWLRSDDISSLQYEPTIQEMEFYESIELDIISSSTPSTIAPTIFQC
ncbi:unnamed protein product [Prunus armeniaca]